MRTLTHAQFKEMNDNLGEFHEIAEFHATGELFQVEFYDTQIDGEDAQLYVVVNFFVEHPNDITHVFDHVEQRHRIPLDASETSHSIIVQHQQRLQRASVVAFNTSKEALDYAAMRVAVLAQSRCYN